MPLRSMERLQLVRLHRGLILVQVRQGIFGTIVMRIIICINCLRFQSCYSVKFLDGGCAQACERPENCPLDFSDLCVLHGIHQRVLRLRGMILKLLRSIFLAERCDLVEIHLEIVSHLLGKVILRSLELAAEVAANLNEASGRLLLEQQGQLWNLLIDMLAILLLRLQTAHIGKSTHLICKSEAKCRFIDKARTHFGLLHGTATHGASYLLRLLFEILASHDSRLYLIHVACRSCCSRGLQERSAVSIAVCLGSYGVGPLEQLAKQSIASPLLTSILSVR
mmetsp:Transcript_1379/g.2534  ORF Transcript_1379/g.2534 Transcript_1379/m.2534 type:complete len:280 (+) Transcript_1379:144-983(+)